MLRLATIGLGYGFLALGVIGLILPVLQGMLFLAIGLVILSPHVPWAKRLLDRLKTRHPRLRHMIERAEAMSRRWMRRLIVRLGRLLRLATNG